MKKILVDTNLILRYLMDNDRGLVELTKSNLVRITNEVIFETVYTLRSYYKLDRLPIFEILTKLIMKPNIECNRVLIFNSLLMYKDFASVSFVDCFLVCLAEQEHLDLYTYDENLRKKVIKRLPPRILD